MHLYVRMRHEPFSTVRSTADQVCTAIDDSSPLAHIDPFLVEPEEPADKGNDTLSPPHTPCPEFSKFLYFIFAPTLIYRDSYPRTSSVRWKYVLSQLAQFCGASVFAYYLFYRFCLPVFGHFKSEHVTLKIFVLSILNCTLPGALLLFCGMSSSFSD